MEYLMDKEIKGKTIVGRELEKSLLADIFLSKKAEFLAVYGRRRIGKTYLIEQFFSQKECIYFHLTGMHKGSLKEHLSIFSKTITKVFLKDLGIEIGLPSTWMSAFESLTNMIQREIQREIQAQTIGQKKIVLFFDELPWLASPKSGFKKALDYYWNTVWSKNDQIILIICGSAASWIIKNIISDKGGLHNRVTLQMPLYPFSLKETYEYLNYVGNKFNHRQTLELYMALGGIPHYLEKIKPHLSATQNISNLFFSRSGPLLQEFDRLFASLFTDAGSYIELIKILADYRFGVPRKKIEKMIKKSGVGGALSERLLALEQTGFIQSFIPIGYTERGRCYKLIDEYCLFYLNWVAPIKRQIEQELDPNYWISKAQTPAWYNWAGYAFESVCLKHMSQIKKALFISGSALAGSWHYQGRSEDQEKFEGAQIDLLFDRDDGVVSICEIKYTQEPFEIDKSYASDLERKVGVFTEHSKVKKQIFLSMVTVDPIKSNKYSAELLTGKVVLEDLFKEKF
jgi:AAA+ ATPase superfamily predicted ATPase